MSGRYWHARTGTRSKLRDARAVTNNHLETHPYSSRRSHASPSSSPQPQPPDEAPNPRGHVPHPRTHSLPSLRSCRHCPGTAKLAITQGASRPHPYLQQGVAEQARGVIAAGVVEMSMGIRS